jgi:hypothetical protein
MTTNELSGCFQPNEITYVCREEIPIYTYIPEVDCEATLLHPSTTRIPDSCECRFFKLSKTLWIPLHSSNQWLFVNPNAETLTILCPHETITVKTQNKGKLTLKPECKGYSSYVTLYAMSTTVTNSSNDYVPYIPVDFDCCFEDLKNVNLEDLPLHVPLVNIMSSVDDLRIASKKTEEVQQMIKEQEFKNDKNFYMVATSWWTTFTIISIIVMCICCSCCCCKCCRNGFFWIWNRWNPKDCWQQAQDKCCVSIYNYNGSRVEYTKTNTSPAISLKSLPEIGSIVTESPRRVKNERPGVEELESISKGTRSKRMFR